MPDVQGINTGSASLGSNLPDTYLNQDMPWRQREKKAPRRFHKGEIIHGIILDIISPSEAYISLPSGNFTAVVSGNLKKGDSLFFQVQETEPSLLLKIFSSSLKVDGVDVPEDELVRILNLPDDKFFRSIIAFYRSKKSVLSRDDVFKIEKASVKIDKDVLSDITVKDLFEIVYFMQENEVPSTSTNFSKLKPAFQSPRLIHERLLELESIAGTVPALQADFNDFFGTMKNSGADLVSRLSLMNSYKRKQAGLQKLAFQYAGYSAGSSQNKELTDFFISLAESAEYMMSIAEQRENSFFLFIPVSVNMFYTVARFTVRNYRKGEDRSHKSAVKPADIMDSIIQTNSFVNDKKSIRHGLFSQSEKACSMLADRLNRIADTLPNLNIEPVSIMISNYPDDDFEISLKNHASQLKNFSVVV